MAVDLKAMREKLAALTKKNENESILKLTEGDTQVRILPLKDSPDNPFVELQFHYINGKTILSPRSYGENDRIADFSDALVAEGGLPKEEYIAAKKLSPQLRTYALVAVRGRETEGGKWWGFGKKNYETILKTMADPDYGDITDIKNGHDLTLSHTPKEKSPTKFANTEITVKPKPRPIHENPEVVQKLLQEQTSIINSFKKWTPEELEEQLQKYLNPSASSAAAPTENNLAASPLASTTQWAGEATPAKPAPQKLTAEIADEFSEIFNS